MTMTCDAIGLSLVPMLPPISKITAYFQVNRPGIGAHAGTL
jgi:hypothetical protein